MGELLGFNVETIRAPTSGKRGPLALTCWDVGGCDKIRPLMRHYASGTDAVVWVLDSNDRERLPEAIDELRNTLRTVEDVRGDENIKDAVPCLILANKQDLPKAMRLDEVRIKLAHVIGSRPSCTVFPTSLVRGDYLSTLTPAMDWLYDALKKDANTQSVSDKLAPQVSTDPLTKKLTSWVDRSSKDVPSGELLTKFEQVDLPSWDHYTHVRIAYTILKTYGRQKGKTLIFDGLEKYIKTSPQTTGRTFHVTMTYFWIQIVHFGMQSVPQDFDFEDVEENKDFCRFLLLNPFVVDGSLWEDYYTKGVIMTPEAKAQMVLPDKKPLPNLIARDSIRR
ncbi:ADP-ribosylation factor family [Ceratobasidium sp. AG-Ba]|nr:ADP-ribosylation factor family [Ceratobasidium sp. AG-Ba]QRW03656.1 ADP-ribosylation factor family [Ceratobasidium sp. AG-Ba]